MQHMADEDNTAEGSEHTAFQHWNYRQIMFFPENQEKIGLSLSDSFYWASKSLVEGVVQGRLREDIEGCAALFLFRHYLELILKEIIIAGRYLATDGGLTQEDVKQITTGHNLGDLWQKVLEDAKPKMPKDAPWENYNCAFAEACVKEFDAADAKGFAFRYKGQGGESAHVDFQRLLVAMDHVYEVLDGSSHCPIRSSGRYFRLACRAPKPSWLVTMTSKITAVRNQVKICSRQLQAVQANDPDFRANRIFSCSSLPVMFMSSSQIASTSSSVKPYCSPQNLTAGPYLPSMYSNA
jgi:hypothetical protein